MKKTTAFILVFFFFMLLSHSCSKKTEKKEDKIIYVDLEKNQKVSFGDLFSHIELIPLETNQQSLIREIRKLIMHDNIFYIFDYNKAEILRFDANGKYLNKISSRGDGPQEYVNISDFEIDTKTKTISLLSAVNNSMYVYDMSGDFVRKYNLPVVRGAYKSFRSLNNDTIVFFTFDYNNRIKFYSKDKKKIIKELLPEKENILNKFAYDEFPYSSYMHRSASSSLFDIDNDCNIHIGYTWNFGSLNNTKS